MRSRLRPFACAGLNALELNAMHGFFHEKNQDNSLFDHHDSQCSSRKRFFVTNDTGHQNRTLNSVSHRMTWRVTISVSNGPAVINGSSARAFSKKKGNINLLFGQASPDEWHRLSLIFARMSPQCVEDSTRPSACLQKPRE